MKHIIGFPLYLLAGIAAIALFAALKSLSLIYGNDCGFIFLRKILGKDSEKWVIIVEKEIFSRKPIKANKNE